MFHRNVRPKAGKTRASTTSPVQPVEKVVLLWKPNASSQAPGQQTAARSSGSYRTRASQTLAPRAYFSHLPELELALLYRLLNPVPRSSPFSGKGKGAAGWHSGSSKHQVGGARGQDAARSDAAPRTAAPRQRPDRTGHTMLDVICSGRTDAMPLKRLPRKLL